MSECIRTMESVIGEGIVSYESTLAIAATIVLGLLNQSRLAQRAVRYDPCHPGLACLTGAPPLVHTGLGSEASGLGERADERSQPTGLGSEASCVGVREYRRTAAGRTADLLKATKVMLTTAEFRGPEQRDGGLLAAPSVPWRGTNLDACLIRSMMWHY